MENSRCVQEKDKTQRKEEMGQDKSDKGNGIYKMEPCSRLTKRNEGSLDRKSCKKHCSWMKSTSDSYCPNSKLFKNYHVHRKTLDCLKKYVKDELRTFDLSQKCETLSR